LSVFLLSAIVQARIKVRQTPSLKISPDCRQLLYHFWTYDAEGIEQVVDPNIRSIGVKSGDSIQLNPPLVANGSVLSSVISSNYYWVVYKADQEVEEVKELYSVPIAGGAVHKLNGPLAPNGDVVNFSAIPGRSQSTAVELIFQSTKQGKWQSRLFLSTHLQNFVRSKTKIPFFGQTCPSAPGCHF